MEFSMPDSNNLFYETPKFGWASLKNSKYHRPSFGITNPFRNSVCVSLSPFVSLQKNYSCTHFLKFKGFTELLKIWTSSNEPLYIVI